MYVNPCGFVPLWLRRPVSVRERRFAEMRPYASMSSYLHTSMSVFLHVRTAMPASVSSVHTSVHEPLWIVRISFDMDIWIGHRCRVSAHTRRYAFRTSVMNRRSVSLPIVRNGKETPSGTRSVRPRTFVAPFGAGLA